MGEDLERLLDELGDAERRAAPSVRFERILERRNRPGMLARLPLGIAAPLRFAADLAHPAVAGTAFAVLTGLALGTWTARSLLDRPSDAASVAYAGSSLLDAEDGGLDQLLAPDEEATAAPQPAPDSDDAGVR